MLRGERSESDCHAQVYPTPLEEVGSLVISGCGAGGDGLATSANALEACDLHQSCYLVSAHVSPAWRMACHTFLAQ